MNITDVPVHFVCPCSFQFVVNQCLNMSLLSFIQQSIFTQTPRTFYICGTNEQSDE